MGRRGGPGPSAMSGGWSQCPDYFLGKLIKSVRVSGSGCEGESVDVRVRVWM